MNASLNMAMKNNRPEKFSKSLVRSNFISAYLPEFGLVIYKLTHNWLNFTPVSCG